MGIFETYYGVFIVEDNKIFHHQEFFSKAEMKLYADKQKDNYLEVGWNKIHEKKYLIWIENDVTNIEWSDNFSTEALLMIKNHLFPNYDWMHKNT